MQRVLISRQNILVHSAWWPGIAKFWTRRFRSILWWSLGFVTDILLDGEMGVSRVSLEVERQDLKSKQ